MSDVTAAPETADALDSYVEETQWMMSTLKALTEIGMHMAREVCVDAAIEHRLAIDTLRDVFGDKLSNAALLAAAEAPKRRDPCAEFGKLSRAVRLAVEQYGRARDDMRAYRLGLSPAQLAERAERLAKAQRDAAVAAAQAAEKARHDAQVKTLRKIVFEAAESEIHDREALYDIERALDERLETATAYFDPPDLPFEETVRRVCADLELSPDWSRWTGDGWALRGAFYHPEGSPYATPSCEPVGPDPARTAVATELRRRLE